MKVKILKEFDLYIDGIHPTHVKAGDVLDLPPDLANSLISGGLASEETKEQKVVNPPEKKKKEE